MDNPSEVIQYNPSLNTAIKQANKISEHFLNEAKKEIDTLHTRQYAEKNPQLLAAHLETKSQILISLLNK